MNNPRYHGKPILRLLECYVLKAIGALSPADTANLTAMQPKLAQIYSASGTWDQIIATSMHLPDNMPVLIQNMWQKHQQTSAEKNISLTPQHFAEMFVDHNLAPQEA
jgi:hypothetical protein